MKHPVMNSRKGMQYKSHPPLSAKEKKRMQRVRDTRETRKSQRFSDKITHSFNEQEIGLVASAVIRVSREVVGRRQNWNLTEFVFTYGDRIIQGTTRDELVDAINLLVNTYLTVTLELWDARHVDAKINLRKILKEAVGLERYEGDDPNYDLIDPLVLHEDHYNPNLQFILRLRNNVTKQMEKEGKGKRMFLNISDIRNHLARNRTEGDLISYWEDRGGLKIEEKADQSVDLSRSILLTFKKLYDHYTLPYKDDKIKSAFALTLGKTGFNLIRMLGSFDIVDEVPRDINRFVTDMNLGGTLQAYRTGIFPRLYKYDIHGAYPFVEKRFRYSNPSTFSEMHHLARDPELLNQLITQGQTLEATGRKYTGHQIYKMFDALPKGKKVQVEVLMKKGWRLKHAVLRVLSISDEVTARNYLVAYKYHLPKSVVRPTIQVKTRYAQGSFESGTECLNAGRVLTTGLEFQDIYNQVKENEGAWIKITAVYQFKNMDFWGEYPDRISKWKSSDDWLIKESAKLVGNTAHGYILMKAKDTFELDPYEQVQTFDGKWHNLLELQKLVRDKGEPIIGLLLADGNRLNVYENLIEKKYDFGKHYYYPALIGAEVIAHARHVLWQYVQKCIEAVGYKHILYANTDCIISDVPLDEYLPISNATGYFSKDVGRGEIIGLGTYWMEIENNDGTTEIDLKISGVSFSVRRTEEQKMKIINGEDFLIYRDETIKRPIAKEAIKTNLNRYRIDPKKRTYSLRYREIEDGFIGLPRLHNSLMKRLPDHNTHDFKGHTKTYYETHENGKTIRHLHVDSYETTENGHKVRHFLPLKESNDKLFRDQG